MGSHITGDEERINYLLNHVSKDDMEKAVDLAIVGGESYCRVDIYSDKPKYIKYIDRACLTENHIEIVLLKFKNLKSLTIEVSGINTLPEGIEKLSNLEEFYLVRSNIRVFYKVIKKLKNFKKLCLFGLKAKTLPKSIGNLKNLEELTLGRSITSIPKEMYNLINLKKLDLGPCRDLFSLPPGISNLRNLEELILSK